VQVNIINTLNAMKKNKIKTDLLHFQEQFKRQLGVTHADRKKWWTNYNADLVNRISEIKKANG
jgi:hypothetical protein